MRAQRARNPLVPPVLRADSHHCIAAYGGTVQLAQNMMPPLVLIQHFIGSFVCSMSTYRGPTHMFPAHQRPCSLVESLLSCAMWRMSREYCSCCLAFTATEQVFVTGHLSRLLLDPGQQVAFVSGPTASRASGGTGSNRDKRVAFYPGWWLQPGQKALILFRLVSPTGTKLLGPLIPFPLPPPEPFSSLVLAVLGSEERSSCSFLHHICEDL